MIGGGENPSYESIWENLHIPTGFLSDFSENGLSYGTIGHELFHRIQAEYYGIIGFKRPANLWWMEASAEYAGYRAAWPHGKVESMHEKTGYDFFSYPISKTGKMKDENGWNKEQSYEYAASVFIQFLVEKKGLNFKDMVEYVASGSPLYTPLEMLNGYNKISLAQYYREFAAWGIFGDDSFLKKYSIAQIAEKNENVETEKDKTLQIIFSSSSNESFINIYKFDKEFERSSQIAEPDSIIGNEQGDQVDVEDGKIIYLLAVNPGKSDDTLTVYLNGDKGVLASHTFNLKGGYSAKLWAINITTKEDSSNFPTIYTNSWDNIVYKGVSFDFSLEVSASGSGAYVRELSINQNSDDTFYINLAIPTPKDGEKHVYRLRGNSSGVSVTGDDRSVSIESLDWDFGYGFFQGNPATVTVTKDRFYAGTSNSSLVKDMLFVIDFDKHYSSDQLGSIGYMRGGIDVNFRRE